MCYPPPNRFMMAPVSILDGGAVERMGAEELNISAGGGKVEMMLLDPKHTQMHTHTHRNDSLKCTMRFYQVQFQCTQYMPE